MRGWLRGMDWRARCEVGGDGEDGDGEEEEANLEDFDLIGVQARKDVDGYRVWAKGGKIFDLGCVGGGDGTLMVAKISNKRRATAMSSEATRVTDTCLGGSPCDGDTSQKQPRVRGGGGGGGEGGGGRAPLWRR